MKLRLQKSDVSSMLLGVAALVMATLAHAEPVQTLAAAQAALQGVNAGVPAEVAQIPQTVEGYDWSLMLALGLGIIGLVWMRRHVAKL